MKGVHFVTDSDGKAVAVQIDIEQWGELWEDMYDRMLIEQRKNEESVFWTEVKRAITGSNHSTPSAPRRRAAH